MDEQPFYRKFWFFILSWLLIGGGFYYWQVRSMGGIRENFGAVFLDLILFVIGLLLWLAFFAQFVLPVSTFRERQKIFDRLITYLSGGHGPAIFIRDGKPVERQGEGKKKAPGVLWLDSASAAVTRNDTSFKQTIGPGVHFTEYGEYLAGIVDLHLQNQSIGPREAEHPFSSKRVDQSEEEYKQVQNRRLEVTAWTRDGIEVVPNISVTFKIDAMPAKDQEEGSRFGYDAESVRKAITGEGVNPNVHGDTPRRRVAWNQLPALIAVDLWREYLSKFTLAELFEPSQLIPPPPPPAPVAPLADTQALLQPVTSSSSIERTLAGIFHEANALLAGILERCERPSEKTVKHVSPAPLQKEKEAKEPKPETALETINRMIKARMTEPRVIVLDDSGKPGSDYVESPEYDLLKRRGIKVVGAGVSNLRFPPNIEEMLVRQWSTSWLDSARAEYERINRQRGYIELIGQVEAVGQYTQSLSRNLLRHRPTTQKDTLKILMLRTRDELVKDDRLHRRASMEREELEGVIQWVERNGP